MSIPHQGEPGLVILANADAVSPGGMTGIANGAIASAGGFTNALAGMAAVVGGGGAGYSSGNLGLGDEDDPPELSLGERPTLESVVWTIPAAPTAFVGTLDADDLLPEPFEGVAPALSYPSVPGRNIDALPTAPTITLSYDEPELTVDLPAIPSLLSLNVMPFDGVNIPSFTEAAPVLTAVAPTAQEYVPGAQYTSALLTAVSETLQDRIENGGTGLAPDVEGAIWDRAREREAIARQDALDQLTRMEALGFSLPTGVYLDAQLRVGREHDERTVGLSREIAIAQAELEQKNVLAALESAIGLESRLLDYSNAVEQRVFESARYITEAGIAIYNGKVQAFAAYVDAYRSRISAYEAQIRGEVSRVEAYRAEIAAEEAKASINRALVDQYTAQISAALSAVDIFKARIEGIKTKAEIEQIKVAIFGEQVRGYTAQIGAYTADIEAYRAQLTAEGTKQSVYASQVDAYRSEVQAGAEAINARVAAYRGQIDAKALELETYKAQVAAMQSESEAVESRNKSTTALYTADANALSSYNESLVKRWQSTIEIARRDAEIAVAASQVSSNQAIAARQISLDAARSAAQISAQIGAAALSAISISQSTSYSTSASNVRSLANSNSSNYSYSEVVSV